MKQLSGKLSINRITHSDRKGTIRITLTDEASSCQAVEIEIGLGEFADCLTGLGHVGCSFEWNDSGVIGSFHQHKEESIPYPSFRRDDTEALTTYLAPYETDGWRARRGDVFNGHRRSQGMVSVTFTRYVDEKGEPIK